MSIKRTSAVWKCSEASGTQLLLLLALADMAKDDGLAWASIETLARRVRVSSRSVARLVNKLERSGELVVVRRPGRHNFYIVTVGLGEADKQAALQRLAALLKEPVDGLARKLFTEPADQSSPVGQRPSTPDTGVTPDTDDTPDPYVTPDTGVTPDTDDTPTPDTSDRGPLIHVSPDPLYEPLKSEPSSPSSAPKGTDDGSAGASAPAPAQGKKARGKKARAARKPKQAADAVKKPSPLVAIVEAYWAGLPAPPANRTYARYMRAAKAIHDAGYTPEQVRSYLSHVYQDEWWRGRVISLERVAEQLPTWLANHAEDDTIEYTDWHEPTATPQEMYEALTLEGKMARARRIRQEAARRSAERMKTLYG